MSKSKKLSQSEAFAPNRKFPNRFLVQPLKIPFVATSIAQNPSGWQEIPVQKNLFGGIICGSAIELPISGHEYAIICDGLEPDMLLFVKLISYLSAHTTVRIFREEDYGFFICSDADDATINSALCWAGRELFGSNVPYRITHTTAQGTKRTSGNLHK